MRPRTDKIHPDLLKTHCTFVMGVNENTKKFGYLVRVPNAYRGCPVAEWSVVEVLRTDGSKVSIKLGPQAGQKLEKGGTRVTYWTYSNARDTRPFTVKLEVLQEDFTEAGAFAGEIPTAHRRGVLFFAMRRLGMANPWITEKAVSWFTPEGNLAYARIPRQHLAKAQPHSILLKAVIL